MAHYGPKKVQSVNILDYLTGSNPLYGHVLYVIHKVWFGCLRKWSWPFHLDCSSICTSVKHFFCFMLNCGEIFRFYYHCFYFMVNTSHFIHFSVSLSVSLFLSLYIYLSFIMLYRVHWLCVCLSVCLPACLSVLSF